MPLPRFASLPTMFNYPDLPAVRHGDDAGTVGCKSNEHRDGQIEVLARRITPTTVITWEIIVRRTIVGSSDKNRWVSGSAPLRVINALELITGSASLTVVEECST